MFLKKDIEGEIVYGLIYGFSSATRWEKVGQTFNNSYQGEVLGLGGSSYQLETWRMRVSRESEASVLNLNLE